MPETSRTHTWPDLAQSQKALRAGAPLEYYRTLRGKLAPDPVASTIGWSIVDAQPGTANIACEVGQHLFHAGGVVHGGVLALLLDSATAIASLTVIEEGERVFTLQLNVQYLNAVLAETGTLHVEGRVTHRTRRTATAAGEVVDATGKIYARATATLLITAVRTS